jgi:hypothetical protein
VRPAIRKEALFSGLWTEELIAEVDFATDLKQAVGARVGGGVPEAIRPVASPSGTGWGRVMPSHEQPHRDATQAVPTWTIGTLLALVAAVAAHVALVSEAFRRSGGWFLPLGMLGMTTFLCLVLGSVFSYRLVPLLALSSTAVLTESLLIQAVGSGRSNAWIVVVAVLGAAMLAAVEVVRRTNFRRRRPR